ncbi:Bug family tripartite tricarboxylate transporter substrate binding protein [Muricoccus vinaceus]|uniref:Bug family tripartite tricarboxylate transporter substrate binding protein n=1 Tax=Muricoccus vinaceus TaxID=424704 RepID=A0ABV6J197_9PROT
MPIRRRHLGAALATAAAALGSRPGLAQSRWPDRPIRLIVPFAPGGGSDIGGRIAAQALGLHLAPPGEAARVSVVVENRPGAGGTIGTEAVVRSPPDGHSLALLTNSSAVMNVFLYKHLSFDIRRDLVAVAEVGRSRCMVAVRPGLAGNLDELRAAARRSSLTYGSGGNGTAPHLAGVLLAQALGAEMTHVPFRGSGPALTAVVSGQVDVMVESVTVLLGMAQANQIRPILVADRERDPLLPAVPTAAELGLPGYEIENWSGLFAPARTPFPIVQALSDALAKGFADPEIAQRLRDLGQRKVTATPAAFDAFWKGELTRWGPVVAASGATLD